MRGNSWCSASVVRVLPAFVPRDQALDLNTVGLSGVT